MPMKFLKVYADLCSVDGVFLSQKHSPKKHINTYNCKCSAGRSDLLLGNFHIYINPYFLYTLCHMAHGLLPLLYTPCFLCICSCSDVLLPTILSVSGCPTQPLPVQLEAR